MTDRYKEAAEEWERLYAEYLPIKKKYDECFLKLNKAPQHTAGNENTRYPDDQSIFEEANVIYEDFSRISKAMDDLVKKTFS